ncbi:MAG: 4'-phosphopantetheinyl transferase superfamily protein [Eubacteriales bacterium]|nr:4'-phosphopantetheinyl transferase superfamily protein [Eubacteriales bacterium]
MEKIFIENTKKDILLKKAFEEVNLKYEDCIIEKNKYGKPYIRNKKNIFYNISHSKEKVAIIISNVEVGIDIEKIRDIDYDKIIKKIFLKEEIDFIMSIENKNEKLKNFFKIWTKREAYSKCIGVGLSLPLNKIYNKNIKLYELQIGDEYVGFYAKKYS